MAVALGWSARRWAAVAVTGLPAFAVMFAFNASAYGHPLRTGYGPIWSAFGVENVPATLGHCATWLPVILTPLVMLVVAFPWMNRARRRERWLLASWVAVFFGFYVFYPFTRQAWWGTRFLLPAFPALVVMMLHVVEAWRLRLAGSGFRSRWIWGDGATLLAGLWLLPWAWELHAWDVGRNAREFRDACTWARANLPANAVVVAMETSGAVYHYTDFPIVHWMLVTPTDAAVIERGAAAAGRPLCALLLRTEEMRVFAELFPHGWRRIGTVGPIGVWRRFPVAATGSR